MPTPGSHAHEIKRQRREKELKNEGLSDSDARERARREMADAADGPNPGSLSDRAAGPYGERTGDGDPGAVIDLRSPSFSSNTLIPPRHTRTAENTPPPLEWEAPPEGTAELVLWCEDLDAPDGPFTHWLVTGIDPSRTSVEGDADVDGGTVWPNDFGDRGYDGPEPPVGDDEHRYKFQVFALDQPLKTSPDDDRDQLRREVDEHKIASGTLIGRFAR